MDLLALFLLNRFALYKPFDYLKVRKGFIMEYHLRNLDRKGYIASIALIDDPKTLRFADQSLAWWDRHFSWKAQGCTVLCDDKGNHLSYLFSKIDRYGEYITLYNLFTPALQRRKGYAKHLLSLIMADALKRHARRITFSSVSESLNFYSALGFIYWGINDIGDYYCNLPLPNEGLEGMESMIQERSTESLLGKNIEKIYAKVHGNESNLTLNQTIKYGKDIEKLGKQYLSDELQEIHTAQEESNL